MESINVLINNNIVVILGRTSKKVFSHGVLKKFGPKKTIKNWLDSKISSLSFDK